MNVLIAEDNAGFHPIYEDLMGEWGFDFDWAWNGEEAVKLALENNGKYDIGLMDTDMPIMNGIEATEQIRQRTVFFPILSVSASNYIKENYLNHGMNGYLDKAFDPDELYQRIKNLTVKRRIIGFKNGEILFQKELPMDSKELEELKTLDNQGLAKFSLVDSSHRFIAHKNLQNKISHDFIKEGKHLTEFLDRSNDEPGLVHLYASNLSANKKHLLPDVLSKLVAQEDEEFKNFTEKTDFPKDE